MKAFNLLVAMTFVAGSAFEAAGQQSFYTGNQLKALSNQNSASAYSIDRQQRAVINSSVPRYGFSAVNRGLLSGAVGGATPRTSRQKPFSNLNRGPTVTPYLALDSPFTSTASSYYSLVRPQLEQQRINEQIQKQNIQLQQQLNDIAARGPYDPQGNENRMPTGHSAVYMNMGGYYPVPQARPPQRN